MSKVFVGNIPYSVTSDGLADILREVGLPHLSAKVILDRETGRSRGFAFVELDDQWDPGDAVRLLDGHVVDGRPLRAREADDRPRSGGGGGRGRSPRRGRGGAREAEFDVWE